MKVKNLVLAGGGVRIISHCGVIVELEKSGVLNELERVAGTSAGAIVAVGVALGIPAKEITKLVFSIDFKKFEDGSKLFEIPRLVEDFGLFKGDYFLDFIFELIEKYTGNKFLTFSELHDLRKQDFIDKGRSDYKDLYVVITKLNTMTSLSASYESLTLKDVPIGYAVRASMSVPLFFEPVRNLESTIFKRKLEPELKPSSNFDFLKFTNMSSIPVLPTKLSPPALQVTPTKTQKERSLKTTKHEQKTTNYESSLSFSEFFKPIISFTPLIFGRKDEIQSEKIKNEENKVLDETKSSIAPEGKDDVLYVDGGVLRNFAINLFDFEKYTARSLEITNPDNPVYNEFTIGVRLDSKEYFERFQDHDVKFTKINSIFGFTKALFSSYWNDQSRLYRDKKNEKRIIDCDTGDIGFLDFNLSVIQKEFLFNKGVEAASKFVERDFIYGFDSIINSTPNTLYQFSLDKDNVPGYVDPTKEGVYFPIEDYTKYKGRIIPKDDTSSYFEIFSNLDHKKCTIL